MKRSAGLILVLSMMLAAMAPAAYVPCEPGTAGDLKTTAQAPLLVTINLGDTRQTIDNFGASDCWSAQYIGKWPDAKRNAIADLLFEQGLDQNNNPKGIGLSLWRFNIGAGSNRQTNIYDEWRRTEVFYNANYSQYDWNAQAGQRWFLQAAKARGCGKFLAFANSPPVHMTKNGFGFCDSSNGDTNLAADKYDDFAIFLADVLRRFRDVDGITFDYVSPVNEPQWDWNGTLSGGVLKNSQEGCRYSNTNIKNLVSELYNQMQTRGLTARILIGEAGQIDYLYTNGTYEGDQVNQFFKTTSANYAGNKLMAAISGHSYWTDLPTTGLVSKRASVRARCLQYGIDYAQTEYCILGDEGNGRDLSMEPALRIGRTLHYDLAAGNASCWQWWLGISPHDYKDGLVYTDKNKTNGNYYDSKMLWVMGNYSRFIRPGMKQIGLTRSDNLTPEQTMEGLMVSSYNNETDGVVVTVFVNRATSASAVKPEFNQLPVGYVITRMIPYVTSDTHDLAAHAALQAGDTLTIPARSVVTLVSAYAKIPALTARWRLDGNLNDEGGNFPGQANGPVYGQGVVEGKQALAINDSASRVTVSDKGHFDFYPQGFSVSAWIRSSTHQWGAIAAKQDRASPWKGWVLTTNENKAAFALRQVHGDLIGGKDVKDDRWHLVTAVYDPQAALSRLYVDGVADGQVATGGLIPVLHSQPLVLGAETAEGFSPFAGWLDDVRIYNYPLSTAEAASLFQQVYDNPVCVTPLPFDWNGDCKVDIDDLVQFMSRWLECHLYPDCF